LPPGSALARMTVTPTNAGSLCASVRALSRMGFERIVYLPDYDAAWDQISLSLWRREHQRLATWMIGARSAAKPVPELPAWKAIAARLQRRVPRRRCGAGIEQVTVTPDGGLYPCYRFAYAKGADVWRLGDVRDGVVHAEKLALLERADVDRLHPEGRSCASCSAADGCTHHCPAVGFLSSGDVHHVPEAVCQLMEAQVASVRELCAASFYAPRTKPAAHPWAKAAAVAAALTGLAACESSSTQAKPDASDANQTHDAGIGDELRDGQFDRAPQILLDAAGPDAGQTIDADQLDSQDSYLPIGGMCW
jgi:radical SAM protein with 4Fe4S-binding SPASM domain